MPLRSIAIATSLSSFSVLVPALALASPTADPPADTTLEPTVEPTVEPTADPTLEPTEPTATGPTAAEPTAAEPRVEATVGATVESPSGELDDRRDQPWIKRWAPEPTMGEFGIYGGILMPNPEHELFEVDSAKPDQGFKPLDKIAPEVGLRLGFYPSRFIGLEAEGAVMPTFVRDSSDPALLYTMRGQVVLQLGLWSVTPFVLVGAGGLGVSSEADVLGNDLDPMLHFGGGLKFYLNRYIQLRVEARDVVSHKLGVNDVWNSHNLEALFSLAFTIGRERDRRQVPTEVVVTTPIASDRDGDGIPDVSDQCPEAAETVNNYLDTDGCPEEDLDGDGFWDEQDSCPNEPETVNGYLDEDGCPEIDSDGDGFWDDQDQCPNEPETVNGFKDQDGCPDEVPEEVRAFTGAIKGITFETNSAAIRSTSIETLNRAAKVLADNPDVRLRIVGHTDSRGDRDHNIDLSRQRAEAVATYLTEQGIDATRLTTEGMGPDAPVDSNETKTGRANNRRIEFELVQ